MEFLILLIIGILGGILAGTLGVGGGIIFTPVLLFLFQDSFSNPVPWVIGTSLLCTFFAASASTFKQFNLGNLFIKESIFVGIGGVVGTVFGRFISLSDWYNQTLFTYVFSAILLITAYRFAVGKKLQIKPDRIKIEDSTKFPIYIAVFIGLIGGVIATVAGVGGGIVMVPILSLIIGFNFMKSASISSAVIVIISFFGWLQFAMSHTVEPSLSGFSLGFVDFGAAFPLIVGSLSGAIIGVKLNHKINKRPLEIAFSILAFIVVIRLLSQL